MAIGLSILIPLAFLIGSFLLTTINSAFRALRVQKTRYVIRDLGKWFFYARLQSYLFPSKAYKVLYFASICGATLCRFGFAASSILFLLGSGVLEDSQSLWSPFIYLTASILLAMIVGEILPRLWGAHYPQSAIRLCAPVASVYLCAFLPISYIFLRLSLSWWERISLDEGSDNNAQMKERIFEIINDEQLGDSIDPDHRRLIESAITFRDRIVREVMVPRVDLLAVSGDSSIRDAGRKLAEEGFSRAPVYDGDLDHIRGIVLYKEVLRVYMECLDNDDMAGLDAPVKTLITEVLYTPETRKISSMLQEFRRRQLHLAIVVDEYGGTEGVVTMEDLLEEIVGEIEDEYDTEEELWARESAGSLIVDARMSILDIQQKLEIAIPQDGDYDTLGGYIFHRAGSIPTKGMVVHHDDFDLEILSSDERRVHKVRVTPLSETD